MNKPECKKMNFIKKLLGKLYCQTDANGNKCWFLNGKLHREEIDPETGLTMPAVEYANGTKCWFLNGKRHREDGPAIELANGDKNWYLNGKRHREDGPVIEWGDGETEYWINGNHIPQLDNKHIYGKERLEKLLLLI